MIYRSVYNENNRRFLCCKKIFCGIYFFITVTKNNLDKKISAMIGDSGTKVSGLGVIVFKDGKEIYSYFGGRRHINPDKPLTRKTLLRAASLSKMFTAFSIMQLVERGKINLTDDVSVCLGFELRNPNFPDTPITIEMLASHTSALRDGTIYSLPPEYTLKEFFRADGVAYENGAHFAPATEPPAKFFTYCNLNYGILGTIIERVTGVRFDLYQKSHVLKPLGIGGGYVVGNFDEKTFENLGTLYQKNKFGKWTATLDEEETPPRKDFVKIENPYAPDAYGSCNLSNYNIGTNATIFSPQGGLRISFDDLGKVLEMLMNRGKKFLDEKSFEEIISSHWNFDAENPNGETLGGVMENYGLGTYKIGGASKARLCKDYEIDLIGHSGAAFGLISGLYFMPNTQNGVAFMINGTAIEPDKDKRSFGNFSANYIWEEKVMNLICRYIFAK